VSLGVRHDLERIVPEIDNPMFDGPSDYPLDTNNFQPRLGFAYDMEEGQGVFRGGCGRFTTRPTSS
jgi:hypothetical protein